MAIRAGTDLDCSTFYEEHALAAVTSGQLAVPDIDVALRHLFKVQFRLGLFDPSEGQAYAQVCRMWRSGWPVWNGIRLDHPSVDRKEER